MIKTLQKVDIEGTYLNIMKVVYDKLVANIIFNGENLKAFPLRSGTRQGCPLPPHFFQYSFESPRYSNQRRKINKRDLNCKRSKNHHCLQMTYYTWKIVKCYRKLQELISEFGKVAIYKTIYKSIAFLYTNNENLER